MTHRIFVAALAILLSIAGGVRAGEDYFMLMFGSQRVPPDPNYSHTFATFVKVSWNGDGPCPKDSILEEHTISWLPCNGKVRLRAFFPECGRNFGLHETMRWNECNGMRTSLWGAYRICPELYFRALNRIALLESGSVRYKANDSFYHSDDVTNCIHAVSSLADGIKLRVGSPGWGETASYFTLLELNPYIINRGCAHPWIATALGLDQYPIIYRDSYRGTRNGSFASLRRLFGAERDWRETYGPP